MVEGNTKYSREKLIWMWANVVEPNIMIGDMEAASLGGTLPYRSRRPLLEKREQDICSGIVRERDQGFQVHDNE